MQQLSRPYQIALGALLVLVLAWFTVLKPSAAAESGGPLPGEGAAVTAPGAAGLGNAVDKANGAAAASGANAAASQPAPAASTGELPASSASTSAPAPASATTNDAAAAAAGDPSAPILRDIARGNVAVLLFSGSDAADDRAVRRALAAVDRRDGKVVVRSAPIARVAKYAAITEGVDVLQAPTLLVIDKNSRARTLVGYTDTRAIDQLVADMAR